MNFSKSFLAPLFVAIALISAVLSYGSMHLLSTSLLSTPFLTTPGSAGNVIKIEGSQLPQSQDNSPSPPCQFISLLVEPRLFILLERTNDEQTNPKKNQKGLYNALESVSEFASDSCIYIHLSFPYILISKFLLL